jgi:hypothetical protein
LHEASLNEHKTVSLVMQYFNWREGEWQLFNYVRTTFLQELTLGKSCCTIFSGWLVYREQTAAD